MKLPIPGPQISPPRPSGQTYSPQPSIQSALEMEIPADRIARKINEMIEATRETSSGSVESDWTTVEAGLRLYLEFTKRPMSPGITVVETTSGFPTGPISTDLPGRPQRQKQPLPRQNEDADVLKNFMTYSQAPAFMDEASVSEKEASEFAIHWSQRSQTTSDPFEPVGPAADRKNDYRLAILSSVAIAGFLGVLGAASATWNPTELSASSTVAATVPTRPPAPSENPEPEPEPKPPAPTGIAAFSPRFETKLW